jgi:hypothetical protein
MTAAPIFQAGTLQIANPTGNERFFVDNGGSVDAWMSLDQIAEFAQQDPQPGTFPANTYNINSAAASTALTAANISGATNLVALNLDGVLAEAAIATLPTAAALVEALPDAAVGQTYLLRVLNTSTGDFAWTIAPSASFTLGATGNYTIAQNSFRDFIVKITGIGADAAATLQDIGGNGAAQ